MTVAPEALAQSRSPAPIRLGLLGPGHPLRGGIVHHNAMLYRALTAAGHTVTATGYRQLYPRLLFPGTTMVDLSLSPVSVPARPLLDPVRPWTWNRVVHDFVEAGVRAVAIHWWHPFHGPCLGWIVRRLARHGIPGVFVVHNLDPHDGMPLGKTLTRFALRGASVLIVQNRRAAGALRTWIPAERIRYLPHPPYEPDAFGSSPRERTEARESLGLPPHGEIVLFFGNIRRYKGLDLLLEAVARAGRPNLHLVVAGEFYHDEIPLRRRLRADDLRDRVTLIDRYIPNEEVGIVMTAADLVALPYRRGSQSGVHGLAFGFGRPVLATDVGGLPEYVEDGVTGRIVPADDASAMATALEEFFAGDDGPRMEQELAHRNGPSTWRDFADCIAAVAGEGVPADQDASPSSPRTATPEENGEASVHGAPDTRPRATTIQMND